MFLIEQIALIYRVLKNPFHNTVLPWFCCSDSRNSFCLQFFCNRIGTFSTEIFIKNPADDSSFLRLNDQIAVFIFPVSIGGRLMINVPFWNRRTIDHLLFVEILSDSPCAMELRIVSSCSLF